MWVGTLRGTIDSNKHKTLTVNDPEYWNFKYDFFDHVFLVTEKF